MEKMPKRNFLGEDRRIFMAGMLANVMYLIIGAALASNFFEKLNNLLKISIAAAILLVASVSTLLYPSVREKRG